jgi:hypothetical protein
MTTNAEGAPFIAAMEREPEPPETQTPGYHDVTVTLDHIGRKVFRIDGMLWDLFRRFRGLFSLAERGPNDFAESDFERGMRAGARYGGGYHEAPKQNGGNASWQKWMMTLFGVLAAIGIGGVVGMYGKLSAVAANQESQQKQLDNLTQMVLNLTRRNQ